MNEMISDMSGLKGLLGSQGLTVLGFLDGAELEDNFHSGDHSPVFQLVLVGSAGSSLWPAFTHSREYSDGLPHPLDRWSKRIGSAVADELEAEVVFPFEGPPYPPVLDWARKTGQASASPISMFIHQDYGLWHAYRFVLLMSKPLSGAVAESTGSHACISCKDQPCLGACPVGAFTGETYRVKDCVTYLAGDENSDCRQQGCSARKACPAGIEFQYRAGHARFHMNAFLLSQCRSEI